MKHPVQMSKSKTTNEQITTSHEKSGKTTKYKKMASPANSNDDSVSPETLSSVFDHAFQLHSDIADSAEDFRSDSFQSKVRKCVMMLEDATRLVSLADVFSRNESIGEVPTEHVKFFLLPALLASANGKLFEDGTDRAETIAVQEAYLRYVFKF